MKNENDVGNSAESLVVTRREVSDGLRSRACRCLSPT
jgi:hypothetical protein